MKRIMLQIFLGFLSSVFGLNSWAQTSSACPDTSKGETPLDCPWAEISRASQASADPTLIKAVFDKKMPAFLDQINKDARAPDLLALWGLSKNIDESHPETTIVSPSLLQYFASILKVNYNATYTQGHAGLTHTYGYLFSTLQTPYGYKRARYVQGEIESGFGIPTPVFSGLSQRGTLLSNFTTFIAPIAFRDSRFSKIDFQFVLDTQQIEALPEIINYPYSELKPKRLLEVVSNSEFYLELRTDIVPFKRPATNQALLIYSIDYHLVGKDSHPRLITAFPVQEEFAKGLFDPTQLGDQVQLRLKYNAALPVDLPAEKLIGKRYIYDEPIKRN